MKKKTIKATVSAVSIATAFAGISVVQADEVTATQPNESTLSTGSTTSSSTNIKQVDGVFVHNGVATVTKTPTSEVVEEARTIKEETDQSVSNQESALEDAKTSEAVAGSKVSKESVNLKNAEANKESATPEKIEKTKNEISEVKADIEKKETSQKDASEKDLEAEKERNQQSAVARLNSISDKTPLAQKNLDEASQQLVAAKTRYAKAQLAVENLNADIQTKQKVLADARAELDKELKVLSDLKAEEAKNEAELRNRQNKVEELKAKESQIKDEISKLKTSLVALETLLDRLENADAYLKKAKEAYDNAVEEHRLALENVAREEAKLKTLLQDQLDATAQYEAVREAYLNTRTRQSEVFNDKVDHKMISLNPALEKSIPESTSNERVYSYAGNQAKYAANRALPNTSSIENWLVFAMGIVLCSFGISVSRKHRD